MVRLSGLLILITLAAPRSGYGQLERALTFQQLDSLQKVEKKPVVVFIHTDWCRYCRAMENTTLQHEAVTTWLDSAYYLVSLDAESKKEISVLGQTFRYQPTGQDTGLHELAQALGTVDGTLDFPTLCFLNTDYEIVHQQVGFIEAAPLAEILRILSNHR